MEQQHAINADAGRSQFCHRPGLALADLRNAIAAVQIVVDNAGAGLVGLIRIALSQFAFLPYYPIWSMILIAMDILIIWALAKQIRQA